jgi:hypothetical protein
MEPKVDEHLRESELSALSRGTAGTEDSSQHLERCLQCRSRFLFLKQFNEALDEELKNDPDPRIARLVDTLASANIIELSQYQAESDLSRLGPAEHTLVLAAKGVESETGPAIAGVTYASSAAGVIVRVVHDKARKNHTLYVLSSTTELRNHVVVAAGNPTVSIRTAVTDSNGVAKLSDTGDIDWKRAVLTIRTPLVKIALDPGANQTNFGSAEDIQAGVSVAPECITVTLDSPIARKAIYAAAVLQNGHAVMAQVSWNKVVLTIPNDARATEIRLY